MPYNNYGTPYNPTIRPAGSASQLPAGSTGYPTQGVNFNTNTAPSYDTQPYQQPSPWTPTPPRATPTTQPTGQVATPNQWRAFGANPVNVDAWATQPARDQYSQYLSATLPLQQFNQNNYQYANDANEAQRRWDNQFGWTQQTDQYNMDLSGRQQTMAEWTAQEAARQWNNQFAQTQSNDTFSQGLANQQFGLAQQTQDQSYQIAAQANQINQAYNEGRLTNDQRQLALAELTQQQNYAFQQQNLTANQDWNRTELASTDAYRAQQNQLAQAQMAQDARMQQASLDAARQNAILQATGRNVAPNTKWMRRT